jgi:hypothetical protein
MMMMVLSLTSAMAVELLSPDIFRSMPGQAVQSTFSEIFRDVVPGIASGLLGVFVGWLAWWGAVESLPETRPQLESIGLEAVAVVSCGICSGSVTADVRMDCPYRCGQCFHSGCYQARVAVYRGDKRYCAVCNTQVA